MNNFRINEDIILKLTYKFLLVFASFCMVFFPSDVYPQIELVVDPGHGGSQPGTITLYDFEDWNDLPPQKRTDS